MESRPKTRRGRSGKSRRNGVRSRCSAGEGRNGEKARLQKSGVAQASARRTARRELWFVPSCSVSTRPLEAPPPTARGRRCTPASYAGRGRRRACERRAAAAGWQVPAEPTMPRLNSQVLGF